MSRGAIFLDRDGVVVRDVFPLVSAAQLEVLQHAGDAIALLHRLGWRVFIVTNQPVVARGLVTLDEVAAIHRELDSRLRAFDPGATPDGYYVCPHHPNATVAELRLDCECRKPKPGLLLRAGREHGLDLSRSVMVGDRPTDIVAGHLSGARACLVRSEESLSAPIESPLRYDPQLAVPDEEFSSLWAFARQLAPTP